MFKHLLLPSLAPAALIWLAFIPKSVFGCANRGYMALALVSLASMGAFATAIKGITAKQAGDVSAANWWTITTLILVTPLILLAGPLG